MMIRQLMKSTQICVTLALNVQVQHHNETRLMALPLIQITWLVFVLWSFWESIFRLRSELSLFVNDLKAAVMFTGKVLTIGLNSLAFGLGVIP